ncbi:hypothetical protein CABS01_10546 [Colletotrichum abscissum]|uniref:Uncharacterized protein n=1 Tax=Colletotrichum abscissum TaxID=1671311 RepID=A0A9Q0B3S1_9PEZI|nr:uncharacterized protein CABS01_10546 [Colletotrichum abscissum]KAI3550097.1 hypothetical protein CABS02_07785 [Colletotrichum abscissum]KAK1498771.1 hypothetical protein CABS01_10546 [Colletotrichum abscissum]
MRASSVLVALFATLAVAVPSNLDSVNLPSLLETRQCAKAGTCSKGGDKGESCSALKCCSNSKSGRGGQVLFLNPLPLFERPVYRLLSAAATED